MLPATQSITRVKEVRAMDFVYMVPRVVASARGRSESTDHTFCWTSFIKVADPAREERMRKEVQQKVRSEEHTSELQSLRHLVCRLLLEKKKHIGGFSSAIVNNDGALRITMQPYLLQHGGRRKLWA